MNFSHSVLGGRTTEPPVGAVSDLVNVISKNANLEDVLKLTTPNIMSKIPKDINEGSYLTLFRPVFKIGYYEIAIANC